MELSEEKKIKLREILEEQLINVPLGQKIHLDKELLEQLLFDIVIYKKESGDFFKLPVWSGPFLRKIDLSDVSFEDVSWSLMSNYRLNLDKFNEKYGVTIDNDIIEKLNDICNTNYVVDFGYTNANIDLNSSFESKKSGYLLVRNCNFAGIDLSNTKIFANSSFYCVNFSYTNINLDTAVDYFNDNIKFIDCNFEGNNYSNIYLDSVLFAEHTCSSNCFYRCNFKNTKLNIKYIFFPTYKKRKTASFDYEKGYDESAIRDFVELYNKGFFIGCFIDNKIVLPDSFMVRPITCDPYKANYIINSCLGKQKDDINSLYDQDFYFSVINDIEGQIRGFRK